MRTVNIIQQAEIQRRAREMKVAMQLWYSILTPQQHALLGATKQFEYLQRYTGSLKEWLPVYYKCFTSESGYAYVSANLLEDGSIKAFTTVIFSGGWTAMIQMAGFDANTDTANFVTEN